MKITLKRTRSDSPPASTPSSAAHTEMSFADSVVSSGTTWSGTQQHCKLKRTSSPRPSPPSSPKPPTHPLTQMSFRADASTSSLDLTLTSSNESDGYSSSSSPPTPLRTPSSSTRSTSPMTSLHAEAMRIFETPVCLIDAAPSRSKVTSTTDSNVARRARNEGTAVQECIIC